MVQALVQSKREAPARPRMEAAELSEALGIEDFTYWEKDNPTFRGVYKGRVMTVEKRVKRRADRQKGVVSRKAWIEAVKRYAREVATPKAGQHLALDWVVVVVTRVTPELSTKKAETKAAAPQMTLEEAAQGQSGRFHVGEAKTFTAEQGQELLARAEVRGQQYLLSLIHEGKLVPSKDIADYWGISSQALGNRKRAGDVFGLMVNNRLWYPAELKSFSSREVAEKACARTKGLAPIEQYLVLTNKHASLGDRTIAEALSKGMQREVERFLDSVVEAE